MRRLYDISNVLCAINLIERLNVPGSEGHKSSLKWVGRDGLNSFEESLNELKNHQVTRAVAASKPWPVTVLYKELMPPGNFFRVKEPKLTRFDEKFYF